MAVIEARFIGELGSDPAGHKASRCMMSALNTDEQSSRRSGRLAAGWASESAST